MPKEFIIANPALIQWILTGISGIVAWFFIRTLLKIDTNQKDLYEKHNNHETRISKVEAVCETRHKLKPGDD